ncbi:diguanylate cyclase with GAF sensor [Richelia sinica FACHB-800]|uniref:Diguanylate cyclase with GAF sensor n=2 Tax=Richelia TaxID=98443 RepID=A0A975T5H8_9NOST|nr:diguanylate cyclase with GAF sensor [Richelia sinica FACHB-800]
MERLLIVSQKLSQQRNLEKAIEIVQRAAREITGADGAAFVLRDNGFCYYVDEDSIAPLWKGQRFPIHVSVSGWVISNAQVAIVEDITHDERVNFHKYKNTFVKSMIEVPIGTEEPVGAIGCYWQELHQPTAEKVKLLQFLAETTAIAMENINQSSDLERQLRDRTIALEAANIRLQQEIVERKAAEAKVRRLSLTDELTGLHNRRGFFILAEQQLRLIQRSRTTASILFIALEHLKYINDSFGREAGDDAIVALASILKRSLRTSDTIGRLEGNKFIILTQGNDPGCEVIQQRLNAAIHKFNQTQNQLFELEITIGVQAFEPSQPLSLDDLVTLAHMHMNQRQRAKQAYHH